MIVLHDDAMREYAYGPAQGLPDRSRSDAPLKDDDDRDDRRGGFVRL
jgi:hypothetical protein